MSKRVEGAQEADDDVGRLRAGRPEAGASRPGSRASTSHCVRSLGAGRHRCRGLRSRFTAAVRPRPCCPRRPRRRRRPSSPAAPRQRCNGEDHEHGQRQQEQCRVGAVPVEAEGHRVHAGTDVDPDQRRRHHDRRRRVPVDGGVPARVVGRAEDDGGTPVGVHLARAVPFTRSASCATTCPGDPRTVLARRGGLRRLAAVEGNREVALLLEQGRIEQGGALACRRSPGWPASTPVVS